MVFAGSQKYVFLASMSWVCKLGFDFAVPLWAITVIRIGVFRAVIWFAVGHGRDILCHAQSCLDDFHIHSQPKYSKTIKKHFSCSVVFLCGSVVFFCGPVVVYCGSVVFFVVLDFVENHYRTTKNTP